MNFGTVASVGGNLIIKCEPHVRTKLRRMFPQVSQRASDTIKLMVNPENCRDLLWFCDRYPMQMDRKSLKQLKGNAKAHIEQESLVSALLSNLRPADDFELAKPARDYQKTAATLLQIKSGLLLADDVGLGKTVSSICAMARSQNLPVLVVTLTHLPEQWQKELRDFAPDLKVHVLKSGQPYDLAPQTRKRKSPSLDGIEPSPRLPDVIISNYHKLNGWSETLAGLVQYVVFDECQELRHSESNKYHAAKHIASKARLKIGLSATPIYNMGTEFFHVINVLLPGCLGTYEEFYREWCSVEGKIADPKAFGAYLRREGIMLRRTRKEVGRELPPFSRMVQTIHTDQAVFDGIKGSAVALARTILAAQQNFRGEKFRASEEFNMLLRQATGIAKAPYVADFVQMLLASEQKVVLFAWHRAVYDIYLERLAEFKPRLYTGSESPQQKLAAKDAFVNGECRVLIISLRAGAGLDGLQDVCRVGVFGELDWSPGVHEQCCGRYFRDGQEEPSLAYFLLAEDGSDPVVADIVGLKRSQIEGVRDPDAELIETLEMDVGNVKRLARSYLEGLNVPLPEMIQHQIGEQDTQDLALLA